MGVAGPGYKGVNLPDDLVDKLDAFVRDNDWGYRSRAEAAASALRVFLQAHELGNLALLNELTRHASTSDRDRDEP